MKLIIKFSLFIWLIFIFTGCSQVAIKTNDVVKYPSWYNTIQKDTNKFYFSSNEGDTKKEAISKALNDIASKISISVSSTYSTTSRLSKRDQKEI